MTDSRLPLAFEELARQLSEPLPGRRDGLELVVQRADLLDGPADRVLVLDVLVSTSTLPRPAPWQLRLPMGPPDPEDRLEDLDSRSFVITCRANLEEWWDRKDYEPAVAAWGRPRR